MDFEINEEWFLEHAEQETISAAMKGLKKGGEAVAGEAQKLTPVLTGTLRRSIVATQGGMPFEEDIFNAAKVSKLKYDKTCGNEKAVYVSANTPYARRQHEEHKTKAKFLEKGLQNVPVSQIEKLIEKEINKL